MKIKKPELKRALRVAFDAEQNTFAELFAGVDLPFRYGGRWYSVPVKIEPDVCFHGKSMYSMDCLFDRIVDKATAHIKAVEEKRKAAQ